MKKKSVAAILFLIIFFCFYLFPGQLAHSSIKAENQETGNEDFKLNELIELQINKKVQIDSSLSIVLLSFSHKRPYPGGSTKATAYLIISDGELTEEIMLSVHGVQGKSEVEDGLSYSSRYDSVIWKSYIIQLKSFNYDKSVKLIVSGIKQ
jgi:hypothetical protein